MNKKLLVSFVAMLTSITMLTACGSDSSTETTDTTDTSDTSDASVQEDVVTQDDGSTSVEDYLAQDEGAYEMDSLELTEQEMAELLGFSGDAETVKEGEMLLTFGTTSLDSFDIDYDASTYNFKYQGNKWIEAGFDIDGTEVVLVDSSPVDFDAPANIYFTPMVEIPSYISMNDYIQMVLDSTLSAFGVDVLSYGVDFYGDYEVGMVETVECYSEELVNEFIELGYFTMDDLNEMGGMEFFTSMPDMYQIFMVARDGEEAYTISGAYYSNDIKRDEVIAAIDGFLQSLVVK